jgi:SAM-dependent methyltransferase
VAAHYERWTYPAPIDDLGLVDFAATDSRYRDLRELFFAYWPTWSYRENLDILVAGCGTMAAACYAYLYPRARITGIDISGASLAHERHLQQKHQLANLTLHQLPLERSAELETNFDFIVSHGVIHHLADPVAGLRALTGILRPHGVIALMVYSWHVRFGVYMLQDFFRLLHLQQDAESVALVKETLHGIGGGHPVRQYLRRPNDLDRDTGLVDAFLHARDKPYTVMDCLELVTGAGLVHQGWDENGLYYPEGQVPPGSKLRAALDRLATPELWKAMELFNGNIPNHWFYACRQDRDPHDYRIQFEDDAFMNYIPVPRVRILPGLGAESGQSIAISRAPYPSVRLDLAQSRVFQQIDRQRSVRECLGLAGIASDHRAVAEFARGLFRTLWRLGYMHFRLP